MAPKENSVAERHIVSMRITGAQSDEIEALYRERFRAFLLSATAMVGNGEAALDLVQEAFALALRRRRSFRREGKLEAWLWQIVVNLARDGYRARLREAPFAQFALATDAEGDSHDELRMSLLALPERQRVTIFLRYYADLSYAEIADVLGVRPGTVAASLHVAHRALRQQLKETRV
jgi:RNA polymerase sigma factor (sigma-70 family)